MRAFKIRILLLLVLLVPGEIAAAPVVKRVPPDGYGQVAFVQGGDIWIKRLPDGEPQRLTTDGNNIKPRWSASGEWLAFSKGNTQVWLSRANGSGAFSLDNGDQIGDFAWSPTQDQLAFVGETGLEIIQGGETATTVVVPASSTTQIGNIDWSPDGTQIAYELWNESADSLPMYESLWIVSSENAEPKEIYSSGVPRQGEAILAGWTGDGSHVIFWQGSLVSASLLADGVPLYSISVEGGEPILLADNVLVYADSVVPQPGNTTQVAVVSGGYRSAWTNKVLSLVDATSGNARVLTASDTAPSSPTWEPGGEHIAYTAMPDMGDLGGGDPARTALLQRHIALMNLDNTAEISALTDDPAYRDEYPRWSADGQFILFVRLDEHDQAALWLISIEGAETMQVVQELGPFPGWFGDYGHVNWNDLFDWWQASS